MEDQLKSVFGHFKADWVNNPQIIMVTEKALKAHGELSPEEFAARLKKMGAVGRAGLNVSLDTQIEEEKDADRLAKLQAVKAALVAYHE